MPKGGIVYFVIIVFVFSLSVPTVFSNHYSGPPLVGNCKNPSGGDYCGGKSFSSSDANCYCDKIAEDNWHDYCSDYFSVCKQPEIAPQELNKPTLSINGDTFYYGSKWTLKVKGAPNSKTYLYCKTPSGKEVCDAFFLCPTYKICNGLELCTTNNLGECSGSGKIEGTEVGESEGWVTINNVESNHITFGVKSGFSLTINGDTYAGLYYGSSWKLKVKGTPNSEAKLFCKTPSGKEICNGLALCTTGPNNGNPSGECSESGKITEGTEIGEWEEWVKINDVESNHITFGVKPTTQNKPQPPTNLKIVTPRTFDEAHLRWDMDDSSVKEFSVYRQEGSGVFKKLINTQYKEWIDKGLFKDAKYSYYVTASNQYGESEPSKYALVEYNYPPIVQISGPESANVGQSFALSGKASVASFRKIVSAGWGYFSTIANCKTEEGKNEGLPSAEVKGSTQVTCNFPGSASFWYLVMNDLGIVASSPNILINIIGPTTEPEQKEDIKCVFQNSNTIQKCYSSDEKYFCFAVESCTVTVKGKKGEKIEWKSTCEGKGTTVIDGIDEKVVFNCGKYPIYSLSDYPKPFLKDGKLDGIVVVGDFSSSSHVADTNKIANSLDSSPNIGKIKLASEVSSLNQNIISVGGPCSNTISGQIEGFPADCTTGLKPGIGKITLYNHNGYVHIVVKGYSDMDNTAAANVLVDYKNYKLSGNEYIVTTINKPPVLTITSAPKTAKAGEPFVIQGKATDEDSNIGSIWLGVTDCELFDFPSSGWGTKNVEFSTKLSCFTPGVHTFTFGAADEQNAVSKEVPVTVDITGKGVVKLVASIDKTFSVDQGFTLKAYAESKGISDITSFNWTIAPDCKLDYKYGGPLFSSITPTNFLQTEVVVYCSSIGNKKFSVTFSDNKGNKLTDYVNVFINDYKPVEITVSSGVKPSTQTGTVKYIRTKDGITKEEIQSSQQQPPITTTSLSSCANRCDKNQYDPKAKCQCDDACTNPNYNDCCADKKQYCG